MGAAPRSTRASTRRCAATSPARSASGAAPCSAGARPAASSGDTLRGVEPPVVEVRGLVKRYGEVVALAGVDLAVRAGEIFALLGPNGAGKTTLISIVAGLTRATEGWARVMGRDVVRDYRFTRRAV